MGDAERVFFLANVLSLPGWLLLVVAPRWRWSARIIGPAILPMILAALYVGMLSLHLPHAQGGFASLADVRLLLQDDWLLLAAWIHYLAFDLFVASWEVRDSQRVGISHVIVVPCLVLTLFAGPVGLLCYLLTRAYHHKAEIE